MEKRLPLFMLLALAVLFGYMWLENRFFPPPPRAKPAAKAKDTLPVAQRTGVANQATGTLAAGQGTGTLAANQGTTAVIAEAPPAAAGPLIEPDLKLPEEYVTLGSRDPNDPARMLVTITNRGAAVVRIELNSDRFRDQEIAYGYLGHLIPVDANPGARVQVVGPGTPAAAAGLQKNDVITAVGRDTVVGAADFIKQLEKHAPGEKVDLAVQRGGQPLVLSATLARRPLELIRPEWQTSPVDLLPSVKHDPLSLLLTLTQIGGEELKADEQEIPGVNLHDVNWEITDRSADHVELTRRLPQRKLSVIKRYRLQPVPAASQEDRNYPAYHVMVEVEIRRDDAAPIDVAYQLDGPNGLPTEGWWYLNKIGRNWGAAGMRDVAANFEDGVPILIGCPAIAEEAKKGKPTIWTEPLAYVGVDTPYFSAILIPQKKLAEKWHRRIVTRAVGTLPMRPDGQPDTGNNRYNVKLINTSCRLTSVTTSISRDKPLKHEYQLFAGPKRRNLLVQYGPPQDLGAINLSELIYYGWQPWAACAWLLSHVLHFFHSFLFNYALAIILLTVVVKLCLFPMSRKQALGAQKVQSLQPEMKKISEKYKDDLEKKTKAMQELYRKHNYHPLSGCLPMLIQMPIFIGLYKALAIDIELRQAPLISEAFFWCRNLAAPDMFWHWAPSPFLPAFVTRPASTLFLFIPTLGPYLNILPLITIALFIWQQKMFMPPATDEQTAMQQKMMKYMMIVMGFMFFTVPAGLCIYFIASSLWGIGERKLLPPPPAAAPGTGGTPPLPPSEAISAKEESAVAARRRKRRERGKQ